MGVIIYVVRDIPRRLRLATVRQRCPFRVQFLMAVEYRAVSKASSQRASSIN